MTGAPAASFGAPLSAAERAQTAATILAAQTASGLIPHADGQHADPWNHLEAAMALAVSGAPDAAERAVAALVAHQEPGGAFAAGYGPDGSVVDRRRDTNGSAYLSFALAQLWHVSGDAALVRRYWPAAVRALGFVCAQQRPSGAICWSDAPSGSRGDLALIAACSSIHASLRAAEDLAMALDLWLPAFVTDAASRLALALTWRRAAFSAKDHYAMDWYYPVLAGVLGGAAARHRLAAGWERFVRPGQGVLCRDDRRWVTAAETAECALACLRAGLRRKADALLVATRAARQDDGSYLTGLVYPELSSFPTGERTTYTAAAVLLAADALAGGPAAAVFAPGRR